MGQVRTAVEREQRHRPLGPMLDDRADAVRIDDVDVQGILDRPGQLRQREPLQQSQHPDVGPRAVARIGRFEPASEEPKALGQLPVLQGPGVIEAARLAFQQRQIVDRLKECPLALPAPGVPSHEPVLVDQPDFLDRGHHHQLAMGVLHGNRIVVGIEPNQRLRVGRCVVNTPGLEGLLGQRQKGGLVFQEQVRPWGPACRASAAGDRTGSPRGVAC